MARINEGVCGYPRVALFVDKGIAEALQSEIQAVSDVTCIA